MPIVEAIVLGIVQGLSEFLPISSSGHLVAMRWLLGWDELSGDAATAFDVAVHVGTLAGALTYLAGDVRRYAVAALAPVLGRGPLSTDGRIGWALVVSAVPAGIVGVALGGGLSDADRVVWVAVALIGFGVLLGIADRSPQRRSREEFGFKHALAMGVGQAVALQPGVSRSGATITVARFLGYERAAAVRLAFLMSLPVIAGAGLYGLVGLDVPADLWPAMAWGAAAAAVTGWAAVWATTRVVAKVGLKPFVAYRLAAGCAILVIAAAGWR